MVRALAAIIILFLVMTSASYAKSFGAKICDSPEFSCLKVKKGQTWQTLFPDETERDTVMRINRMNTRLYSGLVIAVPSSNESDHMKFSPMSEQIDATGSKVIHVSLSKQAFGAYNSDGTLVNWGPVSGGKGYCPDVRRGCHTPVGKFTIYSKGSASCKSTKFPVGKGGAPMPYCMFFYKGFALHGSPNVPGYNDSHGCIRLLTNDAKWLNQDFTADQSRVRVIVNQ